MVITLWLEVHSRGSAVRNEWTV